MKLKPATLLAALALLGTAGAVQAACDVTLVSTQANGQAVLLADCATAITNITWNRDGVAIEPAISPTNATGTTAYYTVALTDGTHSYTASANGGAVAAGKPATITTPQPVLTVVPSEGGTVTANAGSISCTSAGGTCSAPLATGTAVTLTAAKDSTHSWAGWGGDCTGTATLCTLSMTGAKLVTANFGPQPVNGACGTDSNATPVASAPADPGLCVAGSTATAVADPTGEPYDYTWGCNGAHGGTDTSATACSAPKIVNGSCGSQSGATELSSAPSGTGACATGSIISLNAATSAPYTYKWGCSGVHTGTPTAADACSAPMAQVPGACPLTPLAASATAPTTGLCSTGSPILPVTTNASTFTWDCAGQAGGLPTSGGACSSPRIVNGVCGAANGVATASAPTTGLCTAGTASAVAGTGPFTWTCADINDNTPANCSAPLATAGACGAMPNNYSVPSDYPYNSSSATYTVTIPAGQGLALPFTINKTAYPSGYKITDAVGGSKTYKVSKCPGSTDLVDGQNGAISVNGDARADNCGILNMYVRYKETGGATASYYNNSGNLSWQTTCFLPTTTALGNSTAATYYLNILNTGASTVSIQLKNLAQIN